MSVGLSRQPIRLDTAAHSATQVRLQLLGGFRLGVGNATCELSSGSAKLLAFLAIQARPVERTYAANCMWMDKPECRAQANLRSCLWRLRQISTSIVAVSATHLWLVDAVQVDLHEVRDVSNDLMRGVDLDLHAVDPMLFCSELLPAWYDDFIEIEREQLRQTRLHALEQMAAQFLRHGLCYRALNLSLTAVGCDPLRESAHRMVMSIHLAEGNVSEALRQYRLLRGILARDLGIDPSPAATQMVEAWL